MCRNAASRTRGRSPGARWTSSNRYATNRSGTTTARPFSSSEESGLPGVALASSGGLLPIFSTEKRVISCGLPLSKSWKLALVRLPTATPWISRTTTGTTTKLTCDLKAAVSSRVFISGALRLAGACCGGKGGAGGGTVCACAVANSRHPTTDSGFIVYPDCHFSGRRGWLTLLLTRNEEARRHLGGRRCAGVSAGHDRAAAPVRREPGAPRAGVRTVRALSASVVFPRAGLSTGQFPSRSGASVVDLIEHGLLVRTLRHRAGMKPGIGITRDFVIITAYTGSYEIADACRSSLRRATSCRSSGLRGIVQTGD